MVQHTKQILMEMTIVIVYTQVCSRKQKLSSCWFLTTGQGETGKVEPGETT